MGHFSTKYYGSNQHITKIPLLFRQQLPFWTFLVHFWHIGHPISKFRQHVLTKNLGSLPHTLKYTHPKYYVIIIPRSIKIQFWRVRGWRAPFEITTFIYLFFKMSLGFFWFYLTHKPSMVKSIHPNFKIRVSHFVKACDMWNLF